jgi:hypothetical protein
MYEVFTKSILFFIFLTLASTLANAEDVGNGILDVSSSREQKTLVKPSDLLEKSHKTTEAELEALKDISSKETTDFSRF